MNRATTPGWFCGCRAPRALMSSGAAVSFLLFAAPFAQAQTDVAFFRNGDRLTGEVKFLDRGKLSFKTDAAGTIGIQWNDIAELHSAQNFEFTLKDGRRFYGSLQDGAQTSKVRIASGAVTLELSMDDVVRMTPIERRLLDRIKMRTDVGYSFAKANTVETANVGYYFNYRGEERELSLQLDGAISSSADKASSTRLNTVFEYRRFLENRKWDPIAVAQLERNDELGIKRRSTAGGGVSRWIRDSNQNRLSFSTGLVYSTEDTFASSETTESAEGLIGFRGEWFRYEHPEFDVTTALTVFPRLTDEHRTRGNLDVDFTWELFKDLYWRFSIYYSFDDQRRDVDASNTDYGAAVSLGWTF